MFQHTADRCGCVRVLCSQYDQDWCFSTQLIDVAVAAQTRPAQEALLDLLAFEDDSALDYPERYLFAAAYSTHPSEALISDLLVCTLLGR